MNTSPETHVEHQRCEEPFKAYHYVILALCPFAAAIMGVARLFG